MSRRSLFAVGMIVIALALLTTLLVYRYLPASAYVALVTVATMSAFAIYGFDRIAEFDLRNLRLVLRELRQVRDEIYAKESDLRRAAMHLIDLIAFENAWAMRLGKDEADYELRRAWFAKKGRETMAALNVPADEYEHMFRYHEGLAKVDALKGQRVERQQELDRIREMMRAEIDATASEDKRRTPERGSTS